MAIEDGVNNRKRANAPHIDYTVSGLTVDDMLTYNIKQEPISTQTNENLASDAPKHSYRDLTKYCNNDVF